MIKKPNTLRLASAIVVCFIGVSAFRLDVLREPAPIDLPEMTEGIDLPATRLSNPFTEAMRNPRKLTPLPPEMIDNETLWLARAIFSETKRPEEQILVAWVIRNRVETGYRGNAHMKTWSWIRISSAHSFQETWDDPFTFRWMRHQTYGDGSAHCILLMVSAM